MTTAAQPKSKNKHCLQRSLDAARTLRSFAVQAKAYTRGPLGADTGAIRLNQAGTDLRIWLGVKTKFEVFGSKRHRQAVVWFDEPQREIVKHGSVTLYSNRAEELIGCGNLTELERRLASAFWNRHGTWVGAELRRKDVKVEFSEHELAELYAKLELYAELDKRVDPDFYGRTLRTTWRLTAPKSRNTLLVGYDEERMFVCVLPARVDSVAKAHKILRPAGWQTSWKRQGEFFFKPVTPKKQRDLNLLLARQTFSEDLRLEQDSSHKAQIRVVEGRRSYVMGKITDEHAKRHKPLTLDTWNEVVRNREVIVEDGLLSDSARTFD